MEEIMDYLKIGQKAPEFSLMGNDGKEHNLNEFLGKKLVIFFYPKDQTPGCTQEACDFRDYLNVIEAKEAVVLGISADSVSSHQKFIQKYDLNFLLLSDPSKSMLKEYGVLKGDGGISRTTYIISEKGMVERVYPNVKVEDHVEQILADFDEPHRH